MILAPIPVTASTLSLTKKSHGNATLLASRAAGITMTLPAAVGSGTKFRIVVATTIGSNNLVIAVANSSDTMTGTCILCADGGDTTVGFETASDTDTITMNGTSKGGVKGDIIELEDIAANLWSVRITGSGTASEGTPFSAAV